MTVLDKGEIMSGEWITWRGGKRPVAGGVVVKYQMAGAPDEGPATAETLDWDWNDSGHCGDILAYRVVGEASEYKPTHLTSDGGSSDYYKLTIKNKAGETLSCELGDIIRAVVGNDFDLGNIVKATRRMHLAAQGVGKEGTTVTYDANKIKYFADEFAFWHEVF